MRIRVSDWRVIFTIDDAGQVVDIIYIRHRSKAYDRRNRGNDGDVSREDAEDGVSRVPGSRVSS